MILIGSVFSVSAEVEYEIHTGYSSGTICRFGSAGAKSKVEERVLELRTYHAAPGKLDALLSRFREHTCKLFVKHGMQNVGYWMPAENPDNLLIYLMAYSGRESRDASWEAFREDPEWIAVKDASEVDGESVEKVEEVFLTPTEFSEGFAKIVPDRKKGFYAQPYEFIPAPSGNEHLFELRIHTVAQGNLAALKARYDEQALALFAKHGITNLAYFELTSDQVGAETTMIYFLAHKDKKSAERSWAVILADPEWIDLKESGEVTSVFLNPTDFSSVK